MQAAMDLFRLQTDLERLREQILPLPDVPDDLRAQFTDYKGQYEAAVAAFAKLRIDPLRVDDLS